MKTKTSLLLAAIGSLFTLNVQAAPPGTGWSMTFEKVFNTMPAIANVKGKAVPGLLPCDSWNSRKYTNEQEYYCFPGLDSYNPFSISMGSEGVSVLNITCVPTPAGQNANGQPYVSGMMSTGAGSNYPGEVQSSTSFGQQYGYFEMRAKIPSNQGQGYWTGFFLMPYNPGNPNANGTETEYDIFEVIGNSPTVSNQTVHWNSYANSSSTAYNGPNTATGFHTYGFQWDASNIRWYVDGVLTKTQPNQYNAPMYMLWGQAMGGTWPGMANSSTIAPGSFQVEYVRAYAATTATTAVATPVIGTTAQTISNFPSALNLSTNATPYTLTTNTSAGLPITYSVASGPATVTGNTLTITGAGTIALNASAAGDTTYAPMTASETIIVTAPVIVLQTQTIANFPATMSLLTTASPVTLPVSTSAGLTIAYSVVSGPATVSGTTLTVTGAGTVVLQASQAGNSTYSALTATQTITVTTPVIVVQNQTLSGFPATAAYLMANTPTVNLPATTSAGLTVSYTVASGLGSVSGNVLTLTGGGTIVLNATQAGNANFAAFSATQTITVTAPIWAQTLAGFPATANMSMSSPTATLSPISSAGLTVHYTVVSGPATVAGNTLTLTSAGTVVLEAAQSGDSYNAPFVLTQTITVAGLPVTTTPKTTIRGTFFHHRRG